MKDYMIAMTILNVLITPYHQKCVKLDSPDVENYPIVKILKRYKEFGEIEKIEFLDQSVY